MMTHPPAVVGVDATHVPPATANQHKPDRVKVQVLKEEPGVRRFAEPLDLDAAEWRQALKAALATSSDAFVEASLRRLIGAATLPGEAVGTTLSVSAALALVQSLEPENEAQAALAINAACLHAASANIMSRLSTGGGERRIVMLATAASRLERAFHNALETYHRLKRGHTQVIRVEKLEVQAGGQALVGTVQRT